jgi:hypothetical protein
MNTVISNPLELILFIVLFLGTIWIIERVINGAFKTVFLAFLFYLILSAYTLHNHIHNKKKEKPLPPFTYKDFMDADKFKAKYKLYEVSTINNIKQSYKNYKEKVK